MRRSTSNTPGCVSSVGSAWTAEGLSGRCMSSPRLTGRRVQSENGPRATDTIRCGVRGQALGNYWSRCPERSCEIPWIQTPRVSNSSRTTSSGIFLPRFLIGRLHNDRPGEIRCENSHPCSHQQVLLSSEYLFMQKTGQWKTANSNVKAIFVHCIKSRHLFIAWPLATTAVCMTVSSLTKCYTILANKSHVGKHTV